jgi:uncharacterized protein YqgC (DUF456 family)
MIYLELFALVLALITGWLLTLFSLPGNWLIIVALALFTQFVPDANSWHVTWTLVAIEAGLAILAEGLELVAGALGAHRHGGSKRGAVLALVGSLAGAMVGATLGLPIPVVGPVAGVILGASCGALVGAMLGETWKGRDWGDRWQIGQGAFWGRLFGSIAKLALSSLMVVLALGALVWSRF